DEIRKYSLVILPYPFSVSKDAVVKIRAAMDRGTKVISLQRKGEVDEFGDASRSPLLDELKGMQQVTIDITRSNYDAFSRRLMLAILEQLKGRLPLHSNTAGSDVECATLVRET